MEDGIRREVGMVVVVGHAAIRERERAVARRGAGIEVVRPDADEPGSLYLLIDNQAGVLILDVRLPEVGGEDIGAELEQRFPGLHVIVLDGYDHMALLQALTEPGVRTRRPRPAEDEIMAAVRAAVDRRCLLSAEMLLTRSELLPEALTPREYEVLRLMAAGRHNQQIADELGITLKTVEFHGGHVLEKLGVHSRVEAILRARELSSRGETPSHRVA